MRKGVFAVAVLCALALLALPLQAFAQEDPAGGQTTTEQTTTPEQSTTPDQTTTPDETTTVELPADDLEGDDNVPQQYTDPLAGENGNGGDQQGQQQAAPVAVAPVAQTTASELPRTGDPVDGLWIAGGLMVLFGLGLRRACRTREYPYSLPRY